MLIMQACAHTIPVWYRYGSSEAGGGGAEKRYWRKYDKDISFFGLLEVINYLMAHGNGWLISRIG